MDLSRESAFTLALLDDTWAWRQRLVQTLRFGAPSHVEVQSRYQVEIPPALLDKFGVPETAKQLRALLPITTRPKEQLLNLSFTGPSGTPAHLMTRASIASIQAEYLTLMTRSSTVSGVSELLPGDLLEAACLFTPRIARTYGDLASPTALRNYLTDGTGIDMTNGQVAAWMNEARPASRALVQALGEPASPESSTENPLLAIPLLEPVPKSTQTISRILARYVDGIVRLADAGDSNLLAALAEYGRRWEMIVEVDVPVGRPATFAIGEDRPLQVSRAGSLRHQVPLRDARSVHIQASVDDRALEFAYFKVVGLRDDQLPLFEDVRETQEYHAVYTSNPDRPADAIAEVRLRPVLDARLVSDAVLALTVVIIGLALLLTPEPGVLGLLVLPTTFASSLLLVREPASLARVLLARRKRWILGLAGVLWAIVVVQLLRVAAAPWLPELW